MLTNLLIETEAALKRYDKAPRSVHWVGSANGVYAIQWYEFEQLARALEYDTGPGVQVVAYDLVVVGKDWWLERRGIDGQEQWIFKSMPLRQGSTKPFFALRHPQEWMPIASVHDIATT